MNWRAFSIATALLAIGATSAVAQIPPGNNYECHKVKDLKVPAKFVPQTGETAADQVGAFIQDVKKPYLLCNPASINGGPIVDPLLHYCCYKIKANTKVKADYDITDQFGPLRLQTSKPFLQCNACSKAPAP